MPNLDVIVSVRVPKKDLRTLQLLAQVYNQSVGALIRTAVKKQTEELASTEEFRTKAVKIQKELDNQLRQLLKK